MTNQLRSLHELPRSVLHTLEPIGLGTAQVESLTSYFCRLTNSHACTTNDLTQLVIDKVEQGRWNTYYAGDGKSRFVWHERSVSGVGDGALTWASILSELTGISGLDRLTLLPLRSVLAPKALMAQQARWCPHCLDEDLRSGKTPYLRLAWDIGINKFCATHRTPLVSQCGQCKRSNVRHTANFVVPGWCTGCDHFLGYPDELGLDTKAHEEEVILLEQSQKIGELLAASSNGLEPRFQADLQGLHTAIEKLTDEMDGGVCSHFAKRIGMRKSTIHNWRIEKSALTIDALVRLSIHCNISLPQLVQGRLEEWKAPSELRQLGLSFSYPQKQGHRTPRQHDWMAIRDYLRSQLESPVIRSLAEIASDLDIDDRHLYIQATNEARMIGDRYVQYLRRQAKKNESEQLHQLREAAKVIRQEGDSVTVGAVRQVLGKETVNAVRCLYSTLSRINSDLEAANEDCSS